MCITLSDVEKLLASNPSPKTLFGDDPDAVYRELALACHPDRNPGDAMAAKLFAQVAKLHDQLKAKPVVLKLKKHAYTLRHLFATGDVADIWDADDFLVKVSRVPAGAAMLENEANALQAISGSVKGLHYASYFPELMESAKVSGGRYANVFNSFAREWPSLVDVKAAHPNGLDGRHIGWVFKRLLTALGVAHRAGRIHGAIVPEHVLIDPASHSLKLVGWGQSVKSTLKIDADKCDGGYQWTQRLTAISSKRKSFYPPEVFSKKPVSPGTDIYMAARTMDWLGDHAHVPNPIKLFLKSCLLEGQLMRPQDAWKLGDEMTELLRGVYGAPRFVTLDM